MRIAFSLTFLSFLYQYDNDFVYGTHEIRNDHTIIYSYICIHSYSFWPKQHNLHTI